MSPFSAPVLGGAALVSSPALWNAFVEGQTSAITAMSRYLVSVAVVWIALEVVAMMVGPTAKPAAEETLELGEPVEGLLVSPDPADRA